MKFLNQFIKLPTWPVVSIIVPIHNEEKKLEQAMLSLCSLEYPNYEIIAVNDRSTDNTLTILKNIQNTFPCLKIITIKEIPSNWLGKTHALQKGIEESTGSYILLTDADVNFSSYTLNQSIAYMIKHRLGHLTLSPKLIMNSFFTKYYMPFQLFIMILTSSPWRSNSKRVQTAIGIGAFNCVTREAFSAIGMMNKVALNPIDDIGLARELKKSNIKQGIADGQNLIALEWYSSIEELFVGLEKNIFAFFNFSFLKSVAAFLAFIAFIFLPILGLFTRDIVLILLSILPILFVISALFQVNKELLQSKRYILLYPLAALITLCVGVRSVYLCLSRGGIQWGNQFISLHKLKRFVKARQYN